jgi:hypothetical protein
LAAARTPGSDSQSRRAACQKRHPDTSDQETSSAGVEKVSAIRWACRYRMPVVATIFGVAIFAPPVLLFLAVMPRVWSLPTETVNAKNYDFVIAQGTTLSDVPERSTVDRAALKAFVSKHRKTLDAVSDQFCDFERAPVPQLNHTFDAKVSSARNLQHAFLVREMVAEEEKRMLNAADICLDMVRLGQTLARGATWLT